MAQPRPAVSSAPVAAVAGPGPWRNMRFRFFWAGQSISMLGNATSTVALPLLLIVTLGATSQQVGLLRAAVFAPYLALALPAGLLVDRVDRRRLMITADLVRAAVLLAIPAAAIVGAMSVPLIVAATLVASCFTAVFDAASGSILPQLVAPEALERANASLSMSESTAEFVGPSLAGVLVAASGVLAIGIDAATFVVSAWSLVRVGVVDRSPAAVSGTSLRHELTAGARVVWRSAVLRRITCYLGLSNIAAEAFLTVSFSFFLHLDHVGPIELGLLFAVGSVGLFIGAMISARVSRRIGTGPTLLAAAVLDATGLALVAIAPAHGSAPILVSAGGLLVVGTSTTLWNVQSVTVRQMLAPPDQLGRVNAVVRAVAFGSAAVGALIGGWLAPDVSARGVVVGSAVLAAISVTAVTGPAVRQLRLSSR